MSEDKKKTKTIAKAIGIDLESNFINVYKAANGELGLNEQEAICGDSIKILNNSNQIP